MSVWADLEEALSSCTENPSGELALLTEAVTGLEPERFRLLRLRGDLPELTPQQTDRLAALSVHAIADGQVEAMEFRVNKNTKHCGVPLKKLKRRSNVLIACIIHGSQTEIPNGDSTFEIGDTLVVVTSGRGVIKQINDIFE